MLDTEASILFISFHELWRMSDSRPNAETLDVTGQDRGSRKADGSSHTLHPQHGHGTP